MKVIDFGIARALGRITETQTGGMKGKFGYMSPEQASGEEVDLRTDIFALGVVLWESVTGRRLFHRENDLATMRALVYDPIPKPSSVAAIAPELESIIMRALARNPKLRFQTARDMATALERYVVSAGGASVSDLSNGAEGRPSPRITRPGSRPCGRRSTCPPSPRPTCWRPPRLLSPSPAPPPSRRPPGAGRWRCFGAAALALATAALVVTGYRRSESAPPPPATTATPAAEPVVAPPAVPSDNGQLPGAGSPTAPGERTTAEQRTDTGSSRGKATRRKRAGSTRSKNPSNPKIDRRPNPF